MEGSERHRMKMANFHLNNPPKNPKLEKMRNNLTESYKEEDAGLVAEVLAYHLSQIHASYLFHPKGRHALKDICTLMSSTPTLLEFNSWKDLAGALNLSVLQIGCIENYKNADYTHNVLLAYALKKNATLGKLVRALQQIQRIDAISASLKHLKNLGLEAIKEYIELNSEEQPEIIKPPKAFLDELQKQVFITLKDVEIEQNLTTKCNIKDEITYSKLNPNTQIPISEISVQQAIPTTPKVPKCSKKVMVTFAEDGENIARTLASQFRKKRGNIHPIGVLILDDHKEKVLSNPEHFIVHYFHKMDYIIPIITEGYLARIGCSDESRSALACLDPQYVKLIHDLMLKYYTRNTCRNNKIRCVIPDVNYKKIFRHPHMEIDPTLKVYVYESEIEELAKRILRIYD